MKHQKILAQKKKQAERTKHINRHITYLMGLGKTRAEAVKIATGAS